MHVKIGVYVLIHLLLVDTIAAALKDTRAMLTSPEDAKVINTEYYITLLYIF